jgi:hypothetical protein
MPNVGGLNRYPTGFHKPVSYKYNTRTNAKVFCRVFAWWLLILILFF